MASKYYAVKKGKVSGIYLNWNDCKAMVDGYQGAVLKLLLLQYILIVD